MDYMDFREEEILFKSLISITAYPRIETINPDITEYTATNSISITDRQSYTNKRLHLSPFRPAIDSGLPVSRIGSVAQCKCTKASSVGIKNELTNFRINESRRIVYGVL